MTGKKFSELHISEQVKKALDDMHIVEMFPIQEEAIPILLANKDLVGQAQTGTGKTAAFAIPIIEKLDLSNRAVQAIILCPTRELAVQVSGDIQNIGRYKGIRTLAIYGGASMNTQIDILRTGVHIVVGTPGRVLDHLRRGTLRLDRVRTVVLDEADRMLDMGFIEDVESIIKHTPRARQTMMFSATMPEEIQHLAKRHMVNYNFISVSEDEITVKDIQQFYCDTDVNAKFDTLKELLKKENVFSAIIFCNSRSIVNKVVKTLHMEKYSTGSLYGDLSQAQRNRTLDLFKKGKIHILVATDLASRGLNIPDVSHVINYSVPKDPKQYVHRIGRTGRARKSGKAITLVTREDKSLWYAIKNLIDMPIERIDYLPVGYVPKPIVRSPQDQGSYRNNHPRKKQFIHRFSRGSFKRNTSYDNTPHR